MSVLTGMRCKCLICRHPSGSKCDSQLLVESRRENGELRANNARLREASDEIRDQLRKLDLYSLNDDDKFNNAVINLRVALAEIPAASLAAITAPLEARIAELEGVLSSLRANTYAGIAISDRHRLIDAMCLTNLRCIEHDLKEADKALARTPAQSLQAIRAADAQEIKSLKARVKTLEDVLNDLDVLIVTAPQTLYKYTYQLIRERIKQALAAKEPQ